MGKINCASFLTLLSSTLDCASCADGQFGNLDPTHPFVKKTTSYNTSSTKMCLPCSLDCCVGEQMLLTSVGKP